MHPQPTACEQLNLTPLIQDYVTNDRLPTFCCNPAFEYASCRGNHKPLSVLHKPVKNVSFILLVALCVPGLQCRGALTVINRVTFQHIGTLNDSSPDVFSGFTNGEWQKRAVGPRTSAGVAPGWSADAQGVDTNSYFDLNASPYNAAQAGGMVGCWVRFVDFGTAGYYTAPNIANPALVLGLSRADGYQYQCVGVTSSGHIIGTTAGGYYIDGGMITANTWYWVQISWLVSGGTYTLKASYQPLGGSTTVIGTNTDGNAPTKAHALNQPYTYPPNPAQDYRWRGRIGNVTLASLTSFADAVIPDDDIAPSPGPFNWFVNPATGNDSNTGTTAATAWASVAKLNAESGNAGLFGANTYGMGDVVTIDTSVAMLDPGTAQILPATPNAMLQPAAAQRYWMVRAEKDISATSTTWTQYNSALYPNVWMTTDGGAADIGDGIYGAAVIWENDRWLAHPQGTSINSVAAAMSANAAGTGQCWADATTLYLVASDNSDPNTNGHIYTRSRQRGGNGGNGNGSGASLVSVISVPVQIIGLYARKTCLARGNDNDPYNGYGIQFDGIMPIGSTSRTASCYLGDTSKHGIGRTDSSSGHTVNFDACEVEQCSAYSSSSAFVDYNGDAIATGNVSNWNNCTNRYPTGVPGYAVPDYAVTGYPQTPSYLAHNNGSGTQYGTIHFVNSLLGGLLLGGPAVAYTVTGGQILSASFNVPATIDQCLITGFAPSLVTDSVLRNSRIVSTQGVLYHGTYAYLSGSVKVIGNTFDFSNPDQVVFENSPYPLWIRDSPLQLTFENNVVITPVERDFRVLRSAASTDTLTFMHNAFELGGSGYVLDTYDDGTSVANRTLAQMQALMLDVGSFSTANPKLDADDFPALDSPLVDAGVNLGPLVDFTGRYFNTRRTIGALEPKAIFARWQTQHFSPGEITLADIGGPDGDPDGDGQCNLLEYALGTDPKIADVKGSAVSGLPPVDGESYLTLTYRQLEYTADLAYTPGVSSDLSNWQTGSEAVRFVSRVENGDGTATITVRDALPTSVGFARFLRLQVELSQRATQRARPTPAGRLATWSLRLGRIQP